MTDVAALVGAVEGALALGGLVFLRIAAACALLPAFGETVVPVRVKLAGAIALTVLVTPLVAANVRPPEGWAMALLTETLAGLGFGAILRLMVMALQMAGSMAAQSTSLSQILGGHAVDPMPAIAHVMTFAGLALLATTGLHVKFVAYLVLSYDLVPMGTLPDPAGFMQWGTERVTAVFGLAFALSAPFVVAAVVYNLALGVINRAMPQLMVAFVGAPAITAGALALLALCLPSILNVWMSAVDAVLARPTGAP